MCRWYAVWWLETNSPAPCLLLYLYLNEHVDYWQWIFLLSALLNSFTSECESEGETRQERVAVIFDRTILMMRLLYTDAVFKFGVRFRFFLTLFVSTKNCFCSNGSRGRGYNAVVCIKFSIRQSLWKHQFTPKIDSHATNNDIETVYQ